jgi:hypothetical protein
VPSTASIAERLAWGVDAAGGDVIVLCRHLVGLNADWWPQVRRALDSDGTALVGGGLAVPGHMDGPYFRLAIVDRLLNCRWVISPVADGDQAAPVVSTTFCALLRERLRQAGGIDAGLSGAGYHDVELSIRLWRLGYRCLLASGVRAAVRLPDPTTFTRRGFLLNLLRLAAVHFQPPHLSFLLERLRHDPLLAGTLTEVTLSDAGTRREMIDRLAVYDMSWFFSRFLPEAPVTR